MNDISRRVEICTTNTKGASNTVPSKIHISIKIDTTITIRG